MTGTPPEPKPLLRLHDALGNGEPDPSLLDQAPITPEACFFVRNNGTVPAVVSDLAEDWVLTVDGEVRRPFSLSLRELRERFEVVDEIAVLECAGNGRSAIQPATDGLQWGYGAVGCARWTGVRLADLLKAADVLPSAIYIGHESPDRVMGAPDKPALSRGLPIGKAMARETLVAFAMNGAPLSPEHGFPLRIVAPGYPGSAWQKWLNRIWVRDREHDGALMTGTNYRMPRHPISPGDPIDPQQFDVITDLRVKSLITSPAEGFSVRSGESLQIRGFAWSGHTPVDSVTVSADGGARWLTAQLEPAPDNFAWRRFTIDMTPRAAGPIRLMARATDVAGGMQPLQPEWNPRGYLNNSVHKVSGTIT
ncbi:MAG TPA: sulfite oxidase [Hyphomicrobiaceae bacterium]|nr:sulfite oxidase [Hyphomicrobiaceae bacterium]